MISALRQLGLLGERVAIGRYRLAHWRNSTPLRTRSDLFYYLRVTNN